MFGKNKKNDRVAERVDAPGYYRQDDYYDRRRPDLNGGPEYVNMSARHSGEYYTKERYPDGSGDYRRDERYMRNDGSGDYRRDDRYMRYDDSRARRRSANEYYDPRAERRRTQGRVVQQPMYYAQKRKKKRGGKIALGIILALLLIVLALFWSVFGRIKHKGLKDILVNSGLTTSNEYMNVVLYGVDSREGELTKDSHSDTIMICSLNKRTKEVRIASVYRDTYLDNTNGEYRKATECYFYGGPERSVNMLNKNLDLNITDYIAVNFNVVVDVIDQIGGIDLEITEEEMGWINGYCVENEQVTGVGYMPLSTWGNVHLDGIQALAYCRIRYTDGWDYKRTERQRTVLTLAFQKAVSAGPQKILAVANAVIPQIATSMSTVDLIALATSAPKFKIGEQTGFPFDKAPAVINGSDVVVPVNLAANVTQLHEFLYDDDFYTPSETVQQISNEIANASGIY